MANEVRTTRSMAKRKHDGSASDLQQPDATTTDRSESMQPSATASSSVLENHISTSAAPSQILEPSQSSGAADAAPQQPQAIMNQVYNGPTKRKKVIDHKDATLSVLNAEISLMKSKVSTLEVQNVAIKAEDAELEADIAELEAVNAKLEASNDKFRREYISLEALNNSPRHRNAYLEAQNDKLNTQNTKLQDQCDRLQRDMLKAQNTKLHNKYAQIEAAYGDLEGALKQHKLRTKLSLMKKHINKLQDEALFEQDDRGECTRAALKQAQKIIHDAKKGISSYAKRKNSPPSNLIDTYETAIELSDFLYKTARIRWPPKRSGAAILSADTDLSDISSGTDWPSDSAETSDDDDADADADGIDDPGHSGDTDDRDDTEDGYETCDCNDSVDGSDDSIRVRHRPSIWVN